MYLRDWIHLVQKFFMKKYFLFTADFNAQVKSLSWENAATNLKIRSVQC